MPSDPHLDDDALLTTAIRAARAGGEVLRQYFGASDLALVRKGENDFVTRADHESEAAVLAAIRADFPEHAFLGEEGGLLQGSSAVQWIVDPLDGTTNFTQGLRVFCVSVACRHGAETRAGVVYDPLAEELFTARRGGGAFLNGRRLAVSSRESVDGAFLATGFPYRAHAVVDEYLGAFREVFLRARGIRRLGAAALDLAYTAAGIYDGFFEYWLSPWDIAAGALLVEEAGGYVSDLDGGARYLDGGNVIAGAPAVQRELLAVVARHGDESALRRIAEAHARLDARAGTGP